MTADEREYLQRIVDDYYDQFVDTVAEGREMDADALKTPKRASSSAMRRKNVGSSTDSGRETMSRRAGATPWRGREIKEYEPNADDETLRTGTHSRSRSRWDLYRRRR